MTFDSSFNQSHKKMKKLFVFISLCAVVAAQSSAPDFADSNPPEQVKTAFTEKFPEAKKVEWEFEKDQSWEAEFQLSGKEYSASFSAEGQWMETEYEIKTKEIPSEIKGLLDARFKDYDIEEAEISERPAGKFYEFKLEVDDKETELLIDPQGKITIQATKEGEEHED